MPDRRAASLERGPPGEAMFERERVLHVAQAWVRRRPGDDAQQTRTRTFVAGAQRFEPALGFLLQIVEGARRSELTDVSAMETFLPLMPGVR